MGQTPSSLNVKIQKLFAELILEMDIYDKESHSDVVVKFWNKFNQKQLLPIDMISLLQLNLYPVPQRDSARAEKCRVLIGQLAKLVIDYEEAQRKSRIEVRIVPFA